MKEVTLAVKKRNDVGKGAARQARLAGDIPAVVYGPEIDPFPISVAEKDLRAAVKEGSIQSIFGLDVDGKVNKAIIRDIQRDPITNKVTHVDFHAISMNKPLNITIPFHIIGTSVGVKNEGGILQTVMREIDISCLPKDIPESIDIDVTELNVGDSIHISDLEIPNATILDDPSRTIVVVAAPTVIAEPTTAEEGAEGEEGAVGEAAAEAEAKSEGDQDDE